MPCGIWENEVYVCGAWLFIQHIQPPVDRQNHTQIFHNYWTVSMFTLWETLYVPLNQAQKISLGP